MQGWSAVRGAVGAGAGFQQERPDAMDREGLAQMLGWVLPW